MIKIKCPSCNLIQEVRDASVGDTAQCSYCGMALVVPQVQESAVRQEAPGRAAAGTPAQTPVGLGGSASRPAGPEETAQSRGEVHGNTAKRPFGLTWLVFYWVLWGAACIVLGSVLFSASSFLGGAASALSERGGFGMGHEMGQSAAQMEFSSLVGLGIFHYGLLTLVACYGLWTFRRWGFALARAVAVVAVLVSLTGLVVSIAYRTGILAGIVGLIVSAVILAYVFVGPGLFAQVRQRVNLSRLPKGGWQDYE